MKPAADDVMQILDAETSLTPGTDLFVGMVPDSPNNVIVIYDTGGGPTDFVGYRQPTVQVRSRNIDYLNGWDKINEVVEVLNKMGRRTVNSTYYSAWWLQSDVSFLQRDNKDRAIFVANLRGHRSD